LLYPYNKKETITAVTGIIVASLGTTLFGAEITMIFEFIAYFTFTFAILFFVKKKGTGEPGVAILNW